MQVLQDDGFARSGPTNENYVAIRRLAKHRKNGIDLLFPNLTF